MVSKQYQEVVKPYRVLLDKDISAQQIGRSSEIQEMVAQNERVIDEAYRLVEEEGWIPISGKKLTDEKLQSMGRDEVLALINAATLMLAEQEKGRGKSFLDEELSDLMIVAMNELYKGKLKIWRHETVQSSFQR